MPLDEIILTYEAKPIEIKEPAILFIVNRLYEPGITSERLYEITRGNWVLGTRRNKANYAFAVYKGIVLEVYRISSWAPTKARLATQKMKNRWRFEGEVASELQGYVGGSVEAYLKFGARSPIKYINC